MPTADLPAGLASPVRGGLPIGTTESVMGRLFPEPHPHVNDPVGWCESKGIFLWSMQRAIAESVANNRYTAVPSCHGSGKSFLMAVLAAWWLDVHPVGSAFVVTTAPSDRQVKAILWREMRALHEKYSLKGRITLDADWYMGADGKELVAYGRKPQAHVNAEQAMQAFQGIHAEFVLVIVDEAAGVPAWLFNAADSLATNEDARVIAAGNPDDPSAHFERICRPGEGWNVIPISAKDTPNFTGERVPRVLKKGLISKQWVRERIKRWGKTSSLFVAKVLGRFPKVSTDTVITPALVRAAINRDLSDKMIDDPGQYGVDVARYGADETVIYLNRGGVVRIRYSGRKMATTETTGRLLAVLEEDDAEIGQLPVVVDEVGVGGGVVDIGRERGLRIIGFNAGERANNPRKFANRGAEAWWAFKLLMEEGLIDLDETDEDLHAQLQNRKYKMDSAGRYHIESKDDMKKRGLPSPDRADAAIQSVCAVAVEEWDDEIDDELENEAQDLTGDLLSREM